MRIIINYGHKMYRKLLIGHSLGIGKTFQKQLPIMKFKVVSIFFIFMLALTATAQTTQTGYVKTKGRMDGNGKVIPGTRLGGAAITLTGGRSTVSDANGNFTITIPDKKFYLQNVQKQGYQIVDPDLLKKQYVCSTSPLVITMETPDMQLKDRIEAQKRIQATLRKQKLQRERELDSLKEAHKLTEEEYYKKLQQLYDEKANENLVKEMSQRYSEMDFDLVDSFELQLSALILNGELAKADSLLDTRGDIHRDIALLDSIKKTNELENEKLKARQSTLDSSVLYEQWRRQNLAQICSDKVETFKKMNQNDSVAFYLMQMAEIDSSVVEWQLEAGHFFEDIKKDYPQALFYYRRALTILEPLYGAKHPKVEFLYKEIEHIRLLQNDDR